MNKLILLLSVLIFSDFAFSQGDAPALLKGQNQTSSQVGSFIQVPNNQITKLGSATGLIETGNNNILSNPSFEHSTATTGWTISGSATQTTETSVVIHGKKSLKFVAAGNSFSAIQDSTLYQAQFADGVQCLAMVRVKTDIPGVSICPRVAGSTLTTCVTANTDNKWGLYKVPFICGGTSNGISISTGTTAGTAYIDDSFIGAVDLKQDINNVGPWNTFTPTGAWSTNTTYAGKWRQVGENMEIQYYVSTSGAPTSATLTINLPSGYTIATSKLGDTSGSTNGRINSNGAVLDSGTAIFATAFAQYNDTTSLIVRTGNSSAQAVSVTQASPMTWASGDGLWLNVTVPITQFSGSSSVYTSNNADTDWSSCGHVAGDFVNFPTVSSIETFCKREGSDLLMRGKYTSAAGGSASEARLNLKFNGASLTSAASTVTPSTVSIAGDLIANISSTIYFRSSILMEPSVGYITFGSQTSTANLFTKLPGTAFSSVTNSFTARIPISGWTNSNVIIGSFDGLESCASTLDCTDTFSAYVSSSGVVTQENVDWINGNCSISGTSDFNCTPNTGIFTVTPNCTATIYNPGTLVAGVRSTTAANLVSVNTRVPSTGVDAAAAFIVHCQKQGADYIGKTAKAVASDQNIATPGLTKVKACYYGFGGASATLASPTVCSTGTCTEIYDTCGTVSPPTYSATGIYLNVAFAAGTWANSSFVDCKCTAYDSSLSVTKDCRFGTDTGDQTISSTASGAYTIGYVYTTAPGGSGNTASNGYVQVKCEGQAP